jgi:transposase
MESTGHYWLLLYQHLLQCGFEVQLINPRWPKRQPGADGPKSG